MMKLMMMMMMMMMMMIMAMMMTMIMMMITKYSKMCSYICCLPSLIYLQRIKSYLGVKNIRMFSQVWDEIISPFPNFNVYVVEGWE